MLMARLSSSPAEIDSHTPSISKICGSTSTGITIKMIVRQKDRDRIDSIQKQQQENFSAKCH